MDKIIRGLALNEQIKFSFVTSTSVTNEAIKRHDLWPSAASVLGKAMTIALMVGSTLKYDQAVTIKIDGNGPIGQIVTDADSYGSVRGYVNNPHVNFTRKGALDEVTTMGYNGFIDVIKDLKLNDLFTSTVAIQTGNLAQDFSYYFTVSEQTPTAILLGSLFDVDNTCKVCGGILIQLLPETSNEIIDIIEDKISKIKEFSKTLANTTDYNNILKLFFDNDYKVLSEKPCNFFCPCTKERFKNSLITLSKEDLQEMIEKDKGAEIVCHYCNNTYNFNTKDLEEIIKLKEKQNAK